MLRGVHWDTWLHTGVTLAGLEGEEEGGETAPTPLREEDEEGEKEEEGEGEVRGEVFVLQKIDSGYRWLQGVTRGTLGYVVTHRGYTSRVGGRGGRG